MVPAKDILGPNWEVRSTGVEVHGANSLAIKVMNEVGIDISHNTSKLIDTDYLNQCSIVVTLCGDAKDKCPVTPSSVKRIHWSLKDSNQASGNEMERLIVFREVRDQIKQNIKNIFVLNKKTIFQLRKIVFLV